MEMYFLRSVACLAVLLLFYKLLLERENMHVFKRFYLLTAVLASVIIPFITITTYVESGPGGIEPLVINSSEALPESSLSLKDFLPMLLWTVYGLGVIFFSIKFIKNLDQLLQRIRKNPKIKKHQFINVLLKEKVQPHTFFSFIFFNKEKFERREIPQEVIFHEETHARQRHSIDILFVEIIQIIFWMNPLIFLLKDAIRLNHEFLADRAVIKKGANTARYQQTLLSYSSGDLQSDLVNPINYSSIKKRFTVMKTQTSKNAIWLRSLLLIPLTAGLIYSCSNTEELVMPIEEKVLEENAQEIASPEMVSQYNSIARKYNSNQDLLPLVEIEDYKKMRQIYDRMSPEQKQAAEKFPNVEIIEVVGDSDKNIEVVQDPKESATPEMLAEYNRLVKYYNSEPKDNLNVKQEDINIIMSILGKMTPEQKAQAEKINFDVPPPPPPAPAPHPQDAPPPPVSMPLNGKENNLLPTLKDQGLPPPPPPPTYEDLVERGAVFYYNFKEIKPEEARVLVEVEKKVIVHITDVDGKPVVRLTDKKKKD